MKQFFFGSWPDLNWEIRFCMKNIGIVYYHAAPSSQHVARIFLVWRYSVDFINRKLMRCWELQIGIRGFRMLIQHHRICAQMSITQYFWFSLWCVWMCVGLVIHFLWSEFYFPFEFLRSKHIDTCEIDRWHFASDRNWLWSNRWRMYGGRFVAVNFRIEKVKRKSLLRQRTSALYRT